MIERRLRFYVSDAVIYKHYFGDFNLVNKYHSPFPHRDDPRPSFKFVNIGSMKNPRIIWTDFGLSGAKYRDGIGFVMEYFGISRKAAARKIWNELVRDQNVSIKRPVIKYPLNLPYEYGGQPLSDEEMEYWNRLSIPKKLLEAYRISSLAFMRRAGDLIWKSEKDNPTYLYEFSKKDAFKAYRPLDPNKDKFRGQNNGSILEGYDQLPRNGEVLFITSSLKDTLTLRNLGFLAINPTSENSRRALLGKAKELLQRFEKIYILYDNDRPGIIATKVLAQKTGWIPLFLPQHFTKDPSDLVMKSNGRYKQLRKFLYERLGISGEESLQHRRCA